MEIMQGLAAACEAIAGTTKKLLKTGIVADYLKARGIASFKWPERVEIVTEFPTTASGKVQKFELERMLEQKMALNLAAERERE